MKMILFIIGLIFLYFGGEVFVKGTSSTARLFKIRPIIIAITVAAFATSAPEFFVSLTAVLRGSKDLALGNILGSCVANIALVLGICSLIRPIRIEYSILKKELPILIATSLAILIICLDLTISRAEGSFLLFAFFLFIFYCVKNAKGDIENSGEDSTSTSKLKLILFLALGIFLLIAGAHLIVTAAVAIAGHFGISHLVIGLTLVAFGTSLPELGVSAVASFRGKHQTAIGNIIGSNVFNILLIIGTVALVRPIGVNLSTLKFELPLVFVYSLLLLPLLKSGLTLSRKEGLFLLASYVVYIWILFKRG